MLFNLFLLVLSVPEKCSLYKCRAPYLKSSFAFHEEFFDKYLLNIYYMQIAVLCALGT